MSHVVARARTRRTALLPNPDRRLVRLSLPAADYVFAQVTIVSSVMCEPDSHLIKPETSKFVNSNGDCWSNESLRANYESFIGGFNYVNHVQQPEKAVGFLADAVLRRRLIDAAENIYIYYVDLLTATHRESHPSLAEKILSSRIKYLSMGCESFLSTCSLCGHQAEDENDLCEHLLIMKGRFVIDDYGTKRRVGELLGTPEPGSCHFYEASWLTEPPAFGGAVRRSILAIPPGQSVEVVMSPDAAARPAVQKYLKD